MATKKDTELSILEVKTCRMSFNLIGVTPLILNRLSEKTKGQLLLPPVKKNAAEKASTLKHDPLIEFRASAYLSPDKESPTYLRHLATAFKGALRSAALDIPGATKTQIGRLTYVNGEYVSIYGIPKMLMSIVRNSDINHTPDVRTRVIVPKWACSLDVTFIKPLLKEQTVANLLAAAGIMQGVGDWRPGKGSGTYGQFRLTDADDPEFVALTESGSRSEQVAAMHRADPYDIETEELLTWFGTEAKNRGFKVAS